MRFRLTTTPRGFMVAAVISVFALCSGYLELDRASMLDDPVGRMGPERAKRLVDKSKAGEDVVPQLALLGLRPDDVRYVVNSHLHFDHCGGNEFFPRSTFLVQKAEMEAARRPGFAPGYNPSPLDFDHPLDYRLVDGEHAGVRGGRGALFR